jgi:methylenetetrahydrofolate dehydrogenase (NADP+) / methenyltetrahydrofolate cyclohydrolase
VTARLLDGKSIADELLASLRVRVAEHRNAGARVPGLAVILLGDDPASKVYVRNKRLACEKAGLHAIDFDLPASTTQEQLLALISKMNADPTVDGILVQMPLPEHINAKSIIEHIDPAKDVDGFHPVNVGRLVLREPGLRPCTPRGVMTLLAHTDKPHRGAQALVVGVSNHVGRPLVLELMLAGCTVTCAHKFTRDLKAEVGRAEILVVAVGKPNLVPGEWVREGAVVIDVGINRLADGKLVGDVGFAAAVQRASWITPVPGGVGPMTVATLLQNTVDAYTATANSCVRAY